MKPLDPILAAIAESVSGQPPLFDLPPEQARAIFRDIQADRPRAPDPGLQVADRVIPTSDGPLRLRIYRPPQPAFGATIVYLHGGGYMLGNVEDLDEDARQLCVGTSSVVVAVDYRLAPENPLPAAHDDAVRALQWAHEHIGELGGDEDGLCVAGESAGANLAASAAVACRDLGLPLCAQLLIVPAPDLAAALRLARGDGAMHPMLTRDAVRSLLTHALPDTGEPAGLFPFSARHAADLGGLAPAVIGVAGHCPLEEIGRDYASQLLMAGNEVHFHCFEDMFHPFFAFVAASESAARAVDLLLGDLRLILARRRGA